MRARASASGSSPLATPRSAISPSSCEVQRARPASGPIGIAASAGPAACSGGPPESPYVPARAFPDAGLAPQMTAGAAVVVVHIPAGATGMGRTAYGENPLVVDRNTTVTWM